MSKCPNCQSEIDCLKCISLESWERTFDGKKGYSNPEYICNESDHDDFCCPECSETLFTDEEKAKQFLNS